VDGSDNDGAAAATARQRRLDHLSQDAAAVQHDVAALEAQAAADRTLIDHLQAERVVDRERIANLEVALVSARQIGAAMGILMASHQLTVEQAFDQLRLASQRSHRKLREVADEVLLTGALPEGAG
jgi:uncharacterized coiled-coil protein SlyX